MKKRYKKILALFIACVVVFALPCVASASDSVMVSTFDGKSYDGLPEFPSTYSVSSSTGGKRYGIYENYILYSNSDSTMYYLICVDSEEGSLYLNADKRLSSTGFMTLYKSDYSTVFVTESSSRFSVYTCGVGATVWTFKANYSSNTLSAEYGSKLLQTSCDIYNDDSLTSVFIQPEGEALLCQTLTAQTIVKTMMKEVVGLVPLVIGLVILVLAFWKGYQMLHRALRTA